MIESPLPGLRLRPFAGDGDFPAMAEVANAVFAADSMGWVRTPEHIRRDYASFTHFDAARDVAMAEVNDRLVGYVRTAQWIDEKGIRDGVYERLLWDAAQLGQFSDAEVSLDAYPYRVDSIDGVKRARLSALDVCFEQAIQLGYIHANAQAHILLNSSTPEVRDVLSLREVATKLHEVTGDQLISRVEHPQDRYVMHLPFSPPILALLTSDRLFREEALLLRHSAREAFVDDLDALEMQVAPGLRVLDLIKFRRFFEHSYSNKFLCNRKMVSCNSYLQFNQYSAIY
ncbi:MAG: hypothetical protein EOO38_18980 [Cytophagaceae bacterium]|nr:MAG: hypothetical protein EOO38_18980 [Cytophagaceae bacterium]